MALRDHAMPAPTDAVDLASSTSLADLAHTASSCEQAWKQLVARMTPQVAKVIASYRLDPIAAEAAATATWAALARRLDTQLPPPDLTAWLKARTHIECHRISVHGHQEALVRAATAEQHVSHGIGLPDRRSLLERRRADRDAPDRRVRGGSRWSPDALAARLRADRT